MLANWIYTGKSRPGDGILPEIYYVRTCILKSVVNRLKLRINIRDQAG